MSDRPYDAFGHRFFVPVAQGGVAIAGTATALADTAGTIVPVPFASKLVSGSRYNVTGATAAVAAVSAVITKSVAGTGTLSAVGTFVWNGTAASDAMGSAATIVDGTSANFAANDVCSISMAIGTVATVSTHSFSLGWEELPN